MPVIEDMYNDLNVGDSSKLRKFLYSESPFSDLCRERKEFEGFVDKKREIC